MALWKKHFLQIMARISLRTIFLLYQIKNDKLLKLMAQNLETSVDIGASLIGSQTRRAIFRWVFVTFNM